MLRTYYIRVIMVVYTHDPFFPMIQFIIILMLATYPQERSPASPRSAAHTHLRPRPKSHDPPQLSPPPRGFFFCLNLFFALLYTPLTPAKD